LNHYLVDGLFALTGKSSLVTCHLVQRLTDRSWLLVTSYNGSPIEQVETRRFRFIILDDDIPRVTVANNDFRRISVVDYASDREGGDFQFPLFSKLPGNLPCFAPLPFFNQFCLGRAGLAGASLRVEPV
jgi:hypothetical protein